MLPYTRKMQTVGQKRKGAKTLQVIFSLPTHGFSFCFQCTAITTLHYPCSAITSVMPREHRLNHVPYLTLSPSQYHSSTWCHGRLIGFRVVSATSGELDSPKQLTHAKQLFSWHPLNNCTPTAKVPMVMAAAAFTQVWHPRSWLPPSW
jgi:hypothetical protein